MEGGTENNTRIKPEETKTDLEALSEMEKMVQSVIYDISNPDFHLNGDSLLKGINPDGISTNRDMTLFLLENLLKKLSIRIDNVKRVNKTKTKTKTK